MDSAYNQVVKVSQINFIYAGTSTTMGACIHRKCSNVKFILHLKYLFPWQRKFK